MGKSINAMGSSPKATPRLIALMSLQLVIPGRVALQQSPLALHQLEQILHEGTEVGKEQNIKRRV